MKNREIVLMKKDRQRETDGNRYGDIQRKIQIETTHSHACKETEVRQTDIQRQRQNTEELGLNI
jgi:hypothetical protein